MSLSLTLVPDADLFRSLSEIISKELDHNMLKEPIDQTKIKEVWDRLYSRMGDFLGNQDDEEIMSEQLSMFPVQHLYKVSSEFLAFRRWEDFFEEIGFPDFSQRELFMPTAKRTRELWNLIVHFVSHHEAESAYAKEVIRNLTRGEEQVQETLLKLEDLELTIHGMKTEEEQEYPEVERLVVKAKAIQQEVKQLNQEHGFLVENTNSKKEKLESSREYCKQLQENIDEVKERILKLNTSIVESPIEIQNEMMLKTQSVENESKLLKDDYKIIQDLNEQKNQLQIHINHLNEAISRLEHTQNIFEELDSQRKVVAGKVDKAKKIQSEAESTKMKNQDFHNQYCTRVTKNEKNIAVCHQRSNDVQQKRSQALSIAQKLDEEVENINKNIILLQQKKETHQQNIQKKVNEMNNIYVHLESEQALLYEDIKNFHNHISTLCSH